MILPVNHVEQYVTRMSMSMPDKLDYLDSVSGDVRVIVDFGCADGDLIHSHYVKNSHRAVTYIGYDTNPQMVEIAKSRFTYSLNTRVRFTSDWSEVMEMASKVGGKKLLLLSSVIHEVLSYGNESEKDLFWNRVRYSGFDYIAVRDMSYHRSLMKQRTDPQDVRKLVDYLGQDRVMQFERLHGRITNAYSFSHLMLKYRYLDNWEREVAEDYFALDVETFVSKLSGHGRYAPIFFQHYRVPFIVNHAWHNLGVEFKTKTHVKIIMERI